MAGYVDLEMDDESQLDAPMPIPMKDKPRYPYGMRLSLTDAELTKLGIDDNPDVGDYLLMTIVARVTHCSCSDNEIGGPMRCVELQVEKAKALEADAAGADAFTDEETKEGEL